MDSDLFAQLPPTKLFFRCAVPVVVTSVFGTLYSVVDGLFVGRFLGEDAIGVMGYLTDPRKSSRISLTKRRKSAALTEKPFFVLAWKFLHGCIQCGNRFC